MSPFYACAVENLTTNLSLQVELEKRRKLEAEQKRVETEKKKRERLEKQERELRDRILKNMKVCAESERERQERDWSGRRGSLGTGSSRT